MAKNRKQAAKPPAPSPRRRPPTGPCEATDAGLEAFYRRAHEVLTTARARAWRAVNAVMVEAHWEVGRIIVEEERAGEDRADHGKRVPDGLSARRNGDGPIVGLYVSHRPRPDVTPVWALSLVSPAIAWTS